MKKTFSFQLLSKYRGVLMGIQILSIIFYHFTGDCYDQGVHMNGLVRFVYTYIRSSGVDLFLMLSGLGLYFAWKKNPDQQAFYRKRFFRLLTPYILICIPAWVVKDLVISGTGVVRLLKDITFVTLFENGTRWFWYIFFMSVCYLIYPYLFAVVEQAQDRVTEKMRILLLCTVAVMLCMHLKQYESELYGYLGIALYRFPSFFAGCLLGKVTYEKRTTHVWTPWLCLALSMYALMGLGMNGTAILRVYLFALFNFSLCCIFLQLLEWMSGLEYRAASFAYDKIRQILGWFGTYSLELYLSHVAVRKMLNLAGCPTYRYRYFALEVILSVLISILAAKITGILQKKVFK